MAGYINRIDLTNARKVLDELEKAKEALILAQAEIYRIKTEGYYTIVDSVEDARIKYEEEIQILGEEELKEYSEGVDIELSDF